MNLAFFEARLAASLGEIPVGAVLVEGNSGEIIASSGNRMRYTNNPLAHAEMNVIRMGATKLHSLRLVGCDLYVTLEPCPMCAQGISFARIRRLYFGATDQKGGGVESGPQIFSQSTCHHKPDVYGGIDDVRSRKLLKSFFATKR